MGWYLEVTSESFKDDTPLFYATNDPYIIRFVKPLVGCKEKSIPIHDDRVGQICLSQKMQKRKVPHGQAKSEGSLNILDVGDGEFLEKMISSQVDGDEVFDFDEHEYNKYLKHKVRRPDGEITVSIPQDSEHNEEIIPDSEVRESLRSGIVS